MQALRLEKSRWTEKMQTERRPSKKNEPRHEVHQERMSWIKDAE